MFIAKLQVGFISVEVNKEVDEVETYEIKTEDNQSLVLTEYEVRDLYKTISMLKSVGIV